MSTNMLQENRKICCSEWGLHIDDQKPASHNNNNNFMICHLPKSPLWREFHLSVLKLWYPILLPRTLNGAVCEQPYLHQIMAYFYS